LKCRALQAQKKKKKKKKRVSRNNLETRFKKSKIKL